MTNDEELDLALRVLDQQLVDADGRRCGKVDDIDLDTVSGGRASVRALIIGQKAQRARTPRLLRYLGWPPSFGDRACVEISWSHITNITHVVKLGESAVELGLAEGDRQLSQWIARLPKAR